ncbi:AI-2E family transporter [Maricaulaceae bacterium EIL42A08]|nr:AI-2E family transporter [Maricaulaceae bacterium EIL42A08]MCP2679667.1 AI-2E family transporter [Maricaulaceae bacterium NA33B04]
MTETPESLSADRRALQRLFILLLALGVSVVFLWMIRGFLGALFLSAVLALFLMPVENVFSRMLGGRRNLAGSLVLILAVFLVLLPLTAILAIVADQAVQVSSVLVPWVQEQVRSIRADGIEALPQWLPFRDALAPYQQEITTQLAQLVSAAGSFAVSALRSATTGTFGLLLNVVVLLFGLFFFLTQGERLGEKGMAMLPMPRADRDLLVERTLSTIRATVKGTFVIALIQGTLTGVALWLAGVPGAAFWATVTAVLSIVPGVGPPLVWAPAAIWLMATGRYLEGGLLFAWGALVVGVIDNLLRPMLVGKDSKLSDLMVLISTLGGLTLFGPIGIILGPVIAALFASVWYLYGQTYAPLLAERAEASDSDTDQSTDETPLA